MNRFQYYTLSNSGTDFNENLYAKIATIPKPLKNGNNHAGDIHFVVNVFWLSNYHSPRKGKYAVCVRQDLQSVLVTNFQPIDKTHISKGLGYIVTENSIDFYVRCGASQYAVQYNIEGTSSKNIFTEILIKEPFKDIVAENLNLSFPNEINNSVNKEAVCNYLATNRKNPSYITIKDGEVTECFKYNSNSDIVLNLKLKIKFYSNQRNSNVLINLKSTYEGEVIRETFTVSSTADSLKVMESLLTLRAGQSVFLYITQWTGAGLNIEVTPMYNA